MHPPESKQVRQNKTFENTGDVSRHCLVGTIFANGGIWVNFKDRFEVDLVIDLGWIFGGPCVDFEIFCFSTVRPSGTFSESVWSRNEADEI